MPLRATVAPDEDLVYVIAEGRVTAPDVHRCIGNCFASPAFHCGMNLCFVVDADVLPVATLGGLQSVAHRLFRRYREPFVSYRAAFVFLAREHAAAFRKLVDGLPPTIVCQTFDDPAAAFTWLGHADPIFSHARLLGRAKPCVRPREPVPLPARRRETA